MTFGPMTGWTAGRRVFLREGGAMFCLTSKRSTKTLIPVPLVLVDLVRVIEPTPSEVPREVWIVQAHDGGLYCTTHEYLEAEAAEAAEAAAPEDTSTRLVTVEDVADLCRI